MNAILEAIGLVILVVFAMAIFCDNGVSIKLNGQEYNLKIGAGPSKDSK